MNTLIVYLLILTGPHDVPVVIPEPDSQTCENEASALVKQGLHANTYCVRGLSR